MRPCTQPRFAGSPPGAFRATAIREETNMLNRRKAIALACGGAAGLAFPALASAAAKKAASDGVMRLGQTTALSGANGAVGRQVRDAALGWVEEVNGDGRGEGVEIGLTTPHDGGGGGSS